jgi:hypothetical protein
MSRQRYDIGSKWLLHNQGRGALCIGGLHDIRRCEPMAGEIVQNQRFPDGLLQAFIGTNARPLPVLVEIATYPERRALKQAMDDLTLAYSALGGLPELLMFVLRPKGRFRIAEKHTIQSKLGLSRLVVEWRTIELWTLSAAQFLDQRDIGILPWVPLMQMDDPVEDVLERCAERIKREAPAQQRTDMLVVSQVMAELRFPGADLWKVFGGEQAMIESPIWQKWRAQIEQKMILDLLKHRFRSTPREVTRPLRKVTDEKKLRELIHLAADCADLDAFREGVLAAIE